MPEKREIIISLLAIVIIYIPLIITLVMNIKSDREIKLGSLVFWIALTLLEMVAIIAGWLTVFSVKNTFFMLWLLIFTGTDIVKYIKQKKA